MPGRLEDQHADSLDSRALFVNMISEIGDGVGFPAHILGISICLVDASIKPFPIWTYLQLKKNPVHIQGAKRNPDSMA